jgi:hypothetical protein
MSIITTAFLNTIIKVQDLIDTFNTKEPTIAKGTTAQYWRGDKTWQTLTIPTPIPAEPTSFPNSVSVSGGLVTLTKGWYQVTVAGAGGGGCGYNGASGGGGGETRFIVGALGIDIAAGGGSGAQGGGSGYRSGGAGGLASIIFYVMNTNATGRTIIGLGGGVASTTFTGAGGGIDGFGGNAGKAGTKGGPSGAGGGPYGAAGVNASSSSGNNGSNGANGHNSVNNATGGGAAGGSTAPSDGSNGYVTLYKATND